MDAELRVEQAWARAQGLERLPEQPIHAEDDMFRPDVLKAGPDRHRLLYARSGYEAKTVLAHVLAHARPGGRLGDVVLKNFADGEIYWKTAKGKAPMPAFEQKLNEKELWDVVAYVRAFAK